ncbi:MAG: PTS sugar transporter subunit IIB [Deltaproteobacteria bacterium]|nr:PTS sugar transporter subunit IIB [Deltaproteobacteria bacterium]
MAKDLNIVLVRVDSRLVHGQILEAWVPHVRAKCIIVVDDKVAADSFFETVIRMAVPSEIEVIISSVEDFVKKYNFTHGDGKKTIVLFSNLADACDAFNRGFRFDRLNIGNVYNNEYNICCSPSVFLCDNEIKNIENLLKETGVFVELQRVPKGRAVNIKEALKDYWHIKK